MRILDWNSLSERERRAALARPSLESRADIAATALEVINTVRAEGDAALRAYTERFDGVKLETLAVSREEFTAARKELTALQVAALERAIDNVSRFHEAQAPKPFAMDTMPGVRCERIVRAIQAVGLYVPAGSAPLPSAVIMLAVAARIAGCPRRVLCTPPNRQGHANAAVLVAAELCGIDIVFKVGGAQAIAALAYGSGSVPKVDKIFGPGNAWVTAAKQLVSNDPAGAAVDMPAGPSEVLVIADDTARADFVAADLLAQAEHGAGSQVIFVTNCPKLLTAVENELTIQAPKLSRGKHLSEVLEKGCILILVEDVGEAIGIVEDFAPEHLSLVIKDAHQWSTHIRNAGAIFIGNYTPVAAGDFIAGPSHVLPTGGAAKAFSGLTIDQFFRRTSIVEYSERALLRVRPHIETICGLEELDAHARSVTIRFDPENSK